MSRRTIISLSMTVRPVMTHVTPASLQPDPGEAMTSHTALRPDLTARRLVQLDLIIGITETTKYHRELQNCSPSGRVSRTIICQQAHT